MKHLISCIPTIPKPVVHSAMWVAWLSNPAGLDPIKIQIPTSRPCTLSSSHTSQPVYHLNVSSNSRLTHPSSKDVMPPNLPSCFQALSLPALLLVPLSRPVNALPAPQMDKECSPDPCAILKPYPMTPYCYEGQLYCTAAGYITVAMGTCDQWCRSETGKGISGECL